LKLTKTTPLDMEEVLASKSRIRILRVLAMKGPLNITEIRKCTKLNYKSISRALEALKQMRVIGELSIDRTRNFRVKVENAETSALVELIKRLANLERTRSG